MTIYLWESEPGELPRNAVVTISGCPHVSIPSIEPLRLTSLRLHPDGFGVFVQSIRVHDTEELIVPAGSKGVPAEVIAQWTDIGSAVLLPGGRLLVRVLNTAPHRRPTLCAAFVEAKPPRQRRATRYDVLGLGGVDFDPRNEIP